MLIFNNLKSFKFLIKRIRKAKRRIYLTCFIVTDDKYSRAILAALNKASSKGIDVVIYGRNEALVGDVEFGKTMLKNVEFVKTLHFVRPREKIFWVTPKRGCHAKIYVIDNIVISTDRNMSGEYYTTKGDYYEASDLVFKSSYLANKIIKYFHDQETFIVKLNNMTFGLGNITSYVHKLLKSENELKIITATLFPSMQLQKIIITYKHEIITGRTINKTKPFEDAYEKLLYFTAIPKQTYVVNKFLHHKVIVGEKFCAHGSFNLDLCSENMVDEQIAVFHDNKNIHTQLKKEYTKLKKLGVQVKRTSLSPIGFVLQQIAGEVLKRL